MNIYPSALYFRDPFSKQGLIKEDELTGLPTLTSLVFDLILSESHSFQSSVSNRPVEDGSIITDHIQNGLENGSFTGLITNFSILTPGFISNRAQDAFDMMNRLWKEKTVFTFVSVLKVYKNIVITSLSVKRSGDTGEANAFDISFQKIKKVKLKEVEITASIKLNMDLKPITLQAQPLIDMGQQVGMIA